MPNTPQVYVISKDRRGYYIDTLRSVGGVGLRPYDRRRGPYSTLDLARGLVDRKWDGGLRCVPRDVTDPPSVVETWIEIWDNGRDDGTGASPPAVSQ